MALPRDLGSASGANSSRLSLASDAPSRASADSSAVNTTRNGIQVPPELQQRAQAAQARYPIHAVLAEPKSNSSLLPTLPVLPSASSYLPSQLSSLSTTFTSAGNLPKSATPSGKSVAQRRSQAPPIQVSELRKVPKTEFDGYLAEIREEYEQWQNEVRAAAAEAESAEKEARAPGGRSKNRDEVLPPLDDIPRIFFDSTFNLSNPRTFDLVTERIQLTPNASPNLSKLSAAFEPASARNDDSRPSFEHLPGLGPETLQDLAADEVLQDKLSHYTAVIESHLVREIGLRSSSFFAALSNLQTLHQQGQDALGRISELQKTLGTEQGGVGSTAKHGLQILQAQARRRGLERIEESVRAVDEIWTAVEGVKDLVENGEWDGALEVSEQIESAYYASAAASSSSSAGKAANGDHRPPLHHPASSSGSLAATGRRTRSRQQVNLTKLRALASFPSKLALLRAQIAKSLEGELVTVLEHELDTGIDEYVKFAKTGKRWKGKDRDTGNSGAAATAGHALAAVPEEEAEDQEMPAADEAPAQRAEERIRDRIRPVVRALVRADGMDSAITAWRESVLREIRALVREHLPTAEAPALEDDDSFAQAAIRSVSKQSVDLGSISEKSLSLAKKLRALSHADFLALARGTYLGLLACIELVDVQARILSAEWQDNRKLEAERRSRRKGIANAAEVSSPNPSADRLEVPSSVASPASTNGSGAFDAKSSTSEDSATLATEITDVVHAVAELANVRFSKVIGVRTEVHAQLALADFVEIFDLSWDFVVQCERICQRMIVGLRGAMVAQAKMFLQQFHQRNITENARVVEEEQWGAVEVGPNVQTCVALVVQIATSDPPALLIGDRSASSNGVTSASDAVPAEVVLPAGPAKQIDIEGKQFFAVSAGLTTIVALMEYLKVLVNVPMLTTDVMSKLIEFMKVFNSRTCQVVLGAGAMRSAGLKNITAKHLALASQALSIMVSLIPYIREGVRRHLNPKQAVMLTEFDKLKRDYQEHQHEIHAKLVAIMSDRLHVHSRTLEAIDWEAAPAQEGAPNAYMEALVKEHTTLHKVLSRFLHSETVQHIMDQVFVALDAKLTEMYAKVAFKSQRAQDRMLVDVRYLSEKLGSLKGLEGQGPGKNIETLVTSKSVSRPVHSAQPPPSPKIDAPARSSSMPGGGKSSAAPPVVSSVDDATSPPTVAPTLPPAGPTEAASSSIAAQDSASTSTPPEISGEPSDLAPDAERKDSSAAQTTPAEAPPSDVSPASPSPADPPAAHTKKRKTLAERLVESMGRKASAQAAPGSGDSPSFRTSSDLVRPEGEQAQSNPSKQSADSIADATDSARAPEILQEGLDTPTLEKTLALEVPETPIPLPTPTVEELDAVEQDMLASVSMPSQAAEAQASLAGAELEDVPPQEVPPAERSLQADAVSAQAGPTGDPTETDPAAVEEVQPHASADGEAAGGPADGTPKSTDASEEPHSASRIQQVDDNSLAVVPEASSDTVGSPAGPDHDDGTSPTASLSVPASPSPASQSPSAESPEGDLDESLALADDSPAPIAEPAKVDNKPSEGYDHLATDHVREQSIQPLSDPAATAAVDLESEPNVDPPRDENASTETAAASLPTLLTETGEPGKSSSILPSIVVEQPAGGGASVEQSTDDASSDSVVSPSHSNHPEANEQSAPEDAPDSAVEVHDGVGKSSSTGPIPDGPAGGPAAAAEPVTRGEEVSTAAESTAATLRTEEPLATLATVSESSLAIAAAAELSDDNVASAPSPTAAATPAPIETKTLAPASEVTSPSSVTSPPTSPPATNGARKKTLKERLEEAARRRGSPSSPAAAAE